MSENSAQSQWVLDEVNWAITRRSNRILPIRIDHCAPEKFSIRMMRTEFVDYAADSLQAETNLIMSLVRAIKTPARSAESLSGNWSGTFSQDLGPLGLPINYRVQLSLVAETERLTGSMTIIDYPHPQKGPVTMNLSVDGVMSYERFVQINYSSLDSGVLQFGALLSELSGLGNTMNGRFIGYGAISQRIVSGTFELQKD
jgi:hypothetical protein